MRKAFYTLCILFSISIAAQETAYLKIKLQKGDKYQVKTTKKFYESAMKQMTNFETLTVKNVIGNSYNIEIGIDRIIANLSQMETTIQYDSSIDESQMSEQVKGLHSRFKPALNTVVSENVSKTGKSLERKKVAGQLSAQMALQKTNFLELSVKSIKPGDKWTQTREENNLIIQKNYTVKSITKNKVFIEVKGVLQEPYTKNKIGNLIGSIELDKKTGIPIKKEIKLEASIKGQIIKTDVSTTFKKINH